MTPRKYASEGIVLARKNYSEADRILVVYSKDYGKLHLIAKGVRKTESRKRGHIEVFSHIKFSAVHTKGLDLLTEVETLSSFEGIRNNLKKVAVAYYFMEVVGKTTREDEKNDMLFNLLALYMDKLRDSTSLKKLKSEFTEKALIILGFWPRGKKMDNPDYTLEEVIEREMSSARVGKKLLS